MPQPKPRWSLLRLQPHGAARFRTSFKLKVAGAALATTMGALTVAGVTFAGRQWRVEREELVEARTALAQVMAANASSAILFQDRETARRLLTSAKAVPGFRSAQMFDTDGLMMSRIGAGPNAQVSRLSAPTWRFTRQTLEIHVPVRADQHRVGELVLVSDLDDLHQTSLEYAVFVLALLGVVGAASVAAALFLARRVIAPVERLTAAIGEVRRSGEFACSVEAANDIELARLTDDFNALLSELDARDRRLNTVFVELMESRDEAERANRLKTEFLANMSHEIRTPLNGVLGVAQLMAYDQLTPSQAERIAIIQRSGEELLELLNNVLDVAKIEAGQVELEHVAYDLPAAIQQACEASAAVATEKGLHFQVRTSPALDGHWMGDPTRLRQVIGNLVSNAVKFTRSGGVTVTADLSAERAETLVLTVRDTGIGIPEAKIPELFKKFVQADNSTTRTFGGSGLGLAICRELLTLFGGSVVVTSAVGVGSEFRVQVPVTRVATSVGVQTAA